MTPPSRTVRLVAADSERGALLLERLRPGTPLLEERDDDRATRIAARIMSGLWRPLPENHPFPSVARWAEGLVRLRACYGGGSVRVNASGDVTIDGTISANVLFDGTTNRLIVSSSRTGASNAVTITTNKI